MSSVKTSDQLSYELYLELYALVRAYENKRDTYINHIKMIIL